MSIKGVGNKLVKSEGEKLCKWTKFSFVSAGFGQNLVITFVNTFMMTYLIQGLELSSKAILAVTSIMSIAKVWDAISDTIMGVIVDKTRTRWGKLRPYLLFTPIPIGITTIMIFSIPKLAEPQMVIYFGVIYILWGMLYTMCDVPYWGLSSVLTRDLDERNRLISSVRTVGTIAMGAMTLLGPVIAKFFSNAEETTARGWSYTAILISVVGMGLFTLAFFGTKEKLVEEKSSTLKELLLTLAKNKPLILVLLCGILGFGGSIIQVGGPVVALVLFGEEAYFTYMGASIIVAMIISTIATPYILRYVSKKKLMIWDNLFSAGANLLFFILGYKNFIVSLVMIFIIGLLSGCFIVLQTTMVADSVDYLERISNKRQEGMCFSGLTFASKLVGALATIAFGLVVAVTGYEKGIIITEGIRSGIFLSITIIPAICYTLSIIPMLFYRDLESLE